MSPIAASVVSFLEFQIPEAGIRPDIFLRMALAVAAGTLLGIERERHGRAAGLRTTLLVCLAACVAMMVSDGFYVRSFLEMDTAGGWHPDPARLAAGVLAGMGFLGAGVIVHQRDHVVRGVTTAATLWFVTIIGLAFGAGALGIGMAATVGALCILSLVPFLESKIRNDWYSDMGVNFQPSLCSVPAIVAAITPLGVRVKGMDLDDRLGQDLCRVTFHLKYKRQGMVDFSERLTAEVRKLPGVSRITFRA